MACRPISVVAVCAAIIFAASVVVAQPRAKDATFKLSTKAKFTLALNGQKAKMEVDSEFDYAWKSDGKVRTLVVDSFIAKSIANDKEVMNVKMNRAGLTDMKGGMAKETKAEHGPEGLRKLLRDSFGNPICKIEMDQLGKEVKRTIVAEPGASVLVDSGVIPYCTLFHPWYAADKDEWQADSEVSAGNGSATGKLTYTKIPSGKGEQTVKVSGTLVAEGVKAKGGLTIKEGKYAVEGVQTYDPKRREWIVGKLTTNLTFKLFDGDKEVGGAKGILELNFELVTAKK